MSSGSVPFRTPFFYGWVVVFTSAIAMYFSGPGQTYSISVFVDAYIRNLGMNRTEVSGIYSVATLIAGFGLFVVGRLIDRHGARAMAVTVGIGLGLATLWSSFLVGPIGLFISFLFLRLFGQGSLMLVPSTVVPQWFIVRRGRALSFMAYGGLASGATVPLLNNWLIQTWNWHIAWRVWSGLLFLFFVPLVLLLLRNTPEAVGLLPDGEQDAAASEVTGPAAPAMTSVPVHPPEVSWTLREAMRTPVFWFILVCAFVPSMVTTGLTFNLFSILQQHAIDRNYAAVMLSLVPIIGFGSSLASGLLLERVAANRVLVVVFLLKLFELVMLFFASSTGMIFVFILSWGVSQGFLNIANRIIWPNYFGRKHLGSINSVNMMVTVIGSAFGPVPFGWAYDHFGGYQQILIVMMGFTALAAVLAFAARHPGRGGRVATD